MCGKNSKWRWNIFQRKHQRQWHNDKGFKRPSVEEGQIQLSHTSTHQCNDNEESRLVANTVAKKEELLWGQMIQFSSYLNHCWHLPSLHFSHERALVHNTLHFHTSNDNCIPSWVFAQKRKVWWGDGCWHVTPFWTNLLNLKSCLCHQNKKPPQAKLQARRVDFPHYFYEIDNFHRSFCTYQVKKMRRSCRQSALPFYWLLQLVAISVWLSW